ncbi:MAG TPA: hypothetical protein VFH97_00065 [Gemmatimonadales bacterium]|nr:hypothetical protein [Gemmatimonadales bacterium]
MHCRGCAAAVAPTDRFCPACGEPLPGDPPPRTVEMDVAELTRLRAEKERISGELNALLEEGQSRNLTPAERRDWSNRYARWRELTYQITRMMDALSPRAPDDRRHSGPHMAAQIVPHQGDERRRGDDRRDPFWNRVP